MIGIAEREVRVLTALLDQPTMREALDRIAGASNSPDIVFRLRNRGLEIHCERIKTLDRDGKICRPGKYSLPAESRVKALKMLGGAL